VVGVEEKQIVNGVVLCAFQLCFGTQCALFVGDLVNGFIHKTGKKTHSVDLRALIEAHEEQKPINPIRDTREPVSVVLRRDECTFTVEYAVAIEFTTEIVGDNCAFSVMEEDDTRPHTTLCFSSTHIDCICVETAFGGGISS
jgi:hypothetical protein